MGTQSTERSMKCCGMCARCSYFPNLPARSMASYFVVVWRMKRFLPPCAPKASAGNSSGHYLSER